MNKNTRNDGKGQIYLSLQPSEMAVFRAASEVYAAYVASGKVSEGKENAYMQKAIKEAIQIAYHVENYILSDDETVQQDLLK